MNCTETKKNIEPLLDGELSDWQKTAVESHLRICLVCSEAKEEMILLSQFLRESAAVEPPTAALDARVKKAFQKQRSPKRAGFREIVFARFAVPKPAFAALLTLAIAASWAAFQIGKISSTTISLDSPAAATNEKSVQTPAENKVQTVFIEIPVIKEKIVTRTIYVRDAKIEKSKSSPDATRRENNLPLSSSVADNNYFTDVNLKGFQPAAEMGAKIIKGVKEDEK